MKRETYSAEETQSFARDVAQKILKYPPRLEAAFCIALAGDLGAGKTTFAQGFAAGLGVQEKILSPTFLIIKKYEIRNAKSETISKSKIQNPKFSTLYHVDCYRIEGERDLLELGWLDIAADSKNIVLIEWPERVQKLLPPDAILISLHALTLTSRQIILERGMA